jgi:hypothetical protein
VPLGVPAPEVALAPAAACLALAVALGVRAFEVDLPGHHFGWRQLASGIAATAVVLGAFPVLGAVFDGRWHQPQQDLGRQLAWMKERRAQGPFRVLWIGRPADLPLHSWDWGRGLSYATSRAGPPLATDLWPGAPAGSSPRLARAVRYATERRTTQLGRLLAPMAVRYVVVTRRGSPGKPGRLPDAVPWLESELSQQVDLGRVETDESLAVYENAAWVPARATLAEGVVPTESSLLAAATAPLEGARAVLPSSSSPAGAAGPVADHSDVVVSEGPSAGWHLDVAGVAVVRHVAFGVANVFSVDQGGTGRLRYVTSPLRYLVMVVQAVGWAVVIGLVIRQRRRRAR